MEWTIGEGGQPQSQQQLGETSRLSIRLAFCEFQLKTIKLSRACEKGKVKVIKVNEPAAFS